MNLDWLTDGNTVSGAIIAALTITGIWKVWNYSRKRHDTLLKSTYDIDTLFSNYEDLKKSVDDNMTKNNEISLSVKDNSAKIDSLIQESKENRQAFRKVLSIMYRHQEQINLLADRKYKSKFYQLKPIEEIFDADQDNDQDDGTGTSSGF